MLGVFVRGPVFTVTLRARTLRLPSAGFELKLHSGLYSYIVHYVELTVPTPPELWPSNKLQDLAKGWKS